MHRLPHVRGRLPLHRRPLVQLGGTGLLRRLRPVRSFNWEEPAYYADFALGDADAAKHEKHTVEKCIFCTQRVARGEQPACVADCIGRARHFGDLDDPNSEVSKHEKHTVEKCIFCTQRVARGEQPACVADCIGRARHFGDLDDPNSEVSRLLASREYTQLHTEFGTKPSVYYLV